MVIVKFKNAKPLKKLFAAISDSVESGTVQCDDLGLVIRELGRTHNLFLEVRLYLPMFHEYDCPQPHGV